MKTYISVSRLVAASNRRTGRNDPPIRIKRDGVSRWARRVEIKGPSVVVFNQANPQPTGTVWIETEAEVVAE